MFNLPYDGPGDGIRAVVSFDPPVVEGPHIMNVGNSSGRVVNTENGVLLGKMSFQMTANELDMDHWFKLETGADTPQTGIMITIDGINHYYYDATSTFKFTGDTASKDASLDDLVVSSGVQNVDPNLSTYKKYDLNPIFNSNTIDYELKLYEYIDQLDIKSKFKDVNATGKIKIPKRDENNNLVYESDGTTIVYEEHDIQNDIPYQVTINKLGEPDTIIKVIVTAEDGKTTKTYTLVVKRPYGTIKGSIQLGELLRDTIQESYGTYVEYIANATLYKSGLFNWEGIVPKDVSLNDLDNLEIQAQVETDKDNGSYTIYVIPGQYDLILERLGFLANVVKNITILENQVIDLGNKILKEGDVDRSGIIDLDDMVQTITVSDSSLGDGVYEERFDFGQKGYVSMDDMVSIVTNSDNLMVIEEY